MRVQNPNMHHCVQRGTGSASSFQPSPKRCSRDVVAHFWWRRGKTTTAPAEVVLEDEDVDVDLEHALDSLDYHLHDKYTKRGLDPLKVSDAPAKSDVVPTAPPPQRPLAPYIEPPDAVTLDTTMPQINSANTFAPLTDTTGTNSDRAPSTRAETSFSSSRVSPIHDAPEYSVGVGPMSATPLPSDLNGASYAPLSFEACCVVALSMLGAVRLGRNGALDEAVDAKRAAWLELDERVRVSRAQQMRKGAESPEEIAKRISLAKKRAAEEKAERERLQKQYAATAAEEARKAREQAEQARKAYEEEERAKAAELQARLAMERALAAERAQQRREEEARIQMEKEAVERIEREMRAEQERLEREAKAAQMRAEAAERAKLASMRKVFLCSVEGQAAISRAPAGLQTEGRLPVRATIQLAVEGVSLLAGQAGPFSRGAAGVEDAEGLLIFLGGELATEIVRLQTSQYQWQAGGGSGPLTLMDDVELRHWMQQLSMLTHVNATTALRKACRRFRDETGAASSQDFKMRLERGVLPHGNNRRSDAMLDALIDAIEAQGEASYPRVAADLNTIVKDEEGFFQRALSEECRATVTCDFLLEISIAAYLVDRTVKNRPSKTMDAPTWYETTVELVRRWLDSIVQDCKPDALLDTAEIVATALGEDHPVAKHVAVMAERNMSLETKQSILERQRAIEAEIAQQILKQGRPSREVLAEARAKEIEAATPIVERVWALRNVAGSLSIGGEGERRKAKEYLEKALELQRQHLQVENHPGLIGELWRLAQLLVTNVEWYPQAVACMEEIIGIVEAVAQRYSSAGDLVSACAVYEGTCAALEGLLVPMNPALQRISKQAENLFLALEDDEKDQVLNVRRKFNALDKLANWFVDPLEIYSDKVKVNRNASWTANQPLESFCGP